MSLIRPPFWATPRRALRPPFCCQTPGSPHHRVWGTRREDNRRVAGKQGPRLASNCPGPPSPAVSEAPHPQLVPSPASPTKPALAPSVPSLSVSTAIQVSKTGNPAAILTCPSHPPHPHSARTYLPFPSLVWTLQWPLSVSLPHRRVSLSFPDTPCSCQTRLAISFHTSGLSPCLQSPSPTSIIELLFSHKNPSQMPLPLGLSPRFPLRRVVTPAASLRLNRRAHSTFLAARLRASVAARPRWKLLRGTMVMEFCIPRA